MVVTITVWVRAPFLAGDYAEAVRRAEIIRNWFPVNPAAISIEGTAQMYAGHAIESENLHRQLVAQTFGSKVARGIGLNNYACELLFEGRYEEALTLLEEAIRSRPQMPTPYANLAQLYLTQKVFPERALELADFNLRLPTAWGSGKKSLAYMLRLVTRAWAEARNGLAEQARATLKEAFWNADAKKVPYFAELNHLAGETYLALNDIPSARQHFAKAAEVDPNGRIGKMARERLATLPPDNETQPS